MNYPRCKTCKWWGYEQGSPFIDHPPPYFESVEASAKKCGSPKLIDIDASDYSSLGSDGFGLNYPVCDLATAPEFGCVHHEERE